MTGAKKRWTFGLAIAVFVGLILSACSSSERITIEVDGSSTVHPITQRVAEAYRAAGNADVQVPIGISGTGGGFQRFVTGETTISNASRPMRASERAAAMSAGVEFIELTVAYDGIAVVTNPSNSTVSCLSAGQLNQIWAPDSTLSRWSEVDSSFPDAELDLYGPDRDSGTFDYFTEEINGTEGVSRSDYSASANDNVLVQGVTGADYSLGYFGFAYYTANQDRLRLLGIDNGAGCIQPTLETIATGEYEPLSRPLFIYVNRAHYTARSEVQDFVKFYIDNAAELAVEAGYVALPAREYDDERRKLP